MTSARRYGKPFIGGAAAWLAPAMLLAVWWASAAIGATTEWVVTNPRTGLAIEGFDPVAYFINAAARPGRPDLEFRYRGVIWRYRNLGNRATFADNPGDYEPRFGGYDPIAIGRGAPTPGNPQIWLIWEHKLYLFLDPPDSRGVRGRSTRDRHAGRGSVAGHSQFVTGLFRTCRARKQHRARRSGRPTR
jgi:hypothetical protein